MKSATSAAGTTGRNSSVELLRLLSMGLIVVSHVCVHGSVDTAQMPFSINKLLIQWTFLGNLGVVIFIMISGYFLWNKPLRSASVSKLLSQVWFYSVALFLACRFGFGCSYDMQELLAVFLPTIFEEYWFFTAYMVLMLLSPWVNLLLQSMNRQQLQRMLLCLTLLWIVCPTLLRQSMFGGEAGRFILFYCMGAYLNKYPDNLLRRSCVRRLLWMGSLFLMLLSTVLLDLLGTRISAFADKGLILYRKESLLVLGAALGLMAGAVYRKPFCNGFINTAAGCTFGVYLLHDNPMLRKILWKQLLDIGPYTQAPHLIVMIFLYALVVFCSCTAIEYLRQKTVAKPLSALTDRCLSRVFFFIT